MLDNKIFSIIVLYQPDVNKVSELIGKLHSANVEVILVDNGSVNLSNIKFKNINSLISLNSNKGIAYAQNIGIKLASEKGADYIVFFDQDSGIDGKFIPSLFSDFKSLEKTTNVSAVGPRFIDEKKGFYFPALRLNDFGLIDKISVEEIDSPLEVSVLISSGTMISVSSIKKIGLMREEFFIDFVDTEWCFRALSKGYKIYVSSKAIMKHSIGDDTLRIFNFNIPVHSGFRRYYRIRNLFFMWKMPYIPKVLTAKLMISNFFHQILLFALKDKKFDYIKFYIKAVRDGVKQSGKYDL